MDSKNTQKEKVIEAAKGEDLADLLNHIAWTDVLEPELKKVREIYVKQLVSRTLGDLQPTTQKPVVPSKEELAGRVHGIDWITDFIKTTFKGHDAAIEWLRSKGLL